MDCLPVIPLCPKCDERLFLLYFDDTELDACPKCRGLWLDAGELEEIMRASGATPDDAIIRTLYQPGAAPPGRKQMCPRCDSQLEETTLDCPDGTKVAIDRCPEHHGLWFDQGELVRILTLFPESCCTSKTIDYLNRILGDIVSKKR